MEFEFLSINFYEIFLTILSVLILGFASICLFFWFKRSNGKLNDELMINLPSSNKKKIKKKLNFTKSNKLFNSNGDLSVEKPVKSKHIEIRPRPEILENINKEIKFNVSVSPSKPILRKTDDQILVNEENYHENIWSKIPKDEVEIRRSRQSSVVSETRSTLKEIEDTSSKLSRGQKKRLKAKLRVIDLKTGENKGEINTNNNSYEISNEGIYNCVEQNVSQIKSNLNKKAKKRLDKKLKNCPSNSTESSLGNEKLHSFSSAEFEDKNQCESSTEEFKAEEAESPQLLSTENFEINPFINQFTESNSHVKCNKLEIENKELKNEIHNLNQKLNELSVLSTNVVNLKKENEIHMKKQVDLERTCSAIQKELTNSIQKTNSAENRIIRLNNERNQQLSFYDNEIIKCNNKISILEGDIRSKTTDNESLKMNLEQIRHMLSDKEQLIQSQNNELSLLKEQFYKKRMDYQEIEVTANNISMKIKELENQNLKVNEENKKIKTQMEILEKNKEKELENMKIQIRNNEREQNSLISSLQYQLDEFNKEKQLLMFNPETEEIKEENEKLRTLCHDMKKKYSETTLLTGSIPKGFELIEVDKLKQLTSKLNEGNRKLQENCEHYTLLTSQQKEKESNLLEKNAILQNQNNKLKSDVDGNLNDVINLRKYIEELKNELSNKSEYSFNDLKEELAEKCETLLKTKDVLTKLEASVEDEEVKWKNLLDKRNIENEKLEMELNQKKMIINNQNKIISELKSTLQLNNQSQSESILNGSLSVE